MRWKKWAIGVGTTVAVVVPAALLISVAATPRPPLASSRYLLNFAPEQEVQKAADPEYWKQLTPDQKKLVASQDYLDQSIELVKKVLDEYQKTGKDPHWNLEYTNLNSSPTNDELNFFQELTRAILYISQGRINFKMIPRTPASVDQGFNNKDQQMVTWYWSPDYDGLGTWLGYNFSPDFLVPNMWPWLCAQLQGVQNITSTGAKTTWQSSLATFLASTEVSTSYFDGMKENGQPRFKPISFKIGQMVAALDDNITSLKSVTTLPIPSFDKDSAMLVPTVSQMFAFVEKFKIRGTNGIYLSIQNATAAWSMVPSNNQPKGSIGTNGQIQNYEPSLVIDFVNALNYNPSFIPFIGDGPNSKNPKLVRHGANAPDNPKSYINDRDWFLQADVDGNFPFKKDTFSWQSLSDPFAQNLTAWNSCFTDNTTQAGKSVFVNLYSWTTVNNPTDTIIDSQLVAEGTSENNMFAAEVDQVIKWIAAGGVIPEEPANDVQPIDGTKNVYPVVLQPVIQNGETIPAPQNLCLVHENGHYAPRWKFDFKIRPIQWVDTKGNAIENEFLSPRDFWAGWKSYQLAVDGGMSHNDYFIDMLGLDMDATIKYGEKQIELNKYTNDSQTNINDESTWKTFSMFMTNPTLPGQTCEDILANQYFAALPFDNPKVQNIVGYTSPSKIVYTKQGKIDKTATFAGNNIYGSGLATDSFRDLWSAAAYYVLDCNQSSFTLQMNKSYFDAFKKEAQHPSTKDHLNKYLQFSEASEAPFGPNGEMVKIKKIDKINCSYLGYNIKTTYDQFKNGSRDMAQIPSNEMASLGMPVKGSTDSSAGNNNKLTKDIFSPLVAQENQTKLMPYNTNVFTSTKTKQGITVTQAQLTAQGQAKGINPTAWGLIPGETDVYGNTVKWKPVPIDGNWEDNGVQPEIGDLEPILKEHIPSQYYDLIVKNYNSNAHMSELIKVFNTNQGQAGQTINGHPISGPEDILKFSSIIIRNGINNAINWLDMADVCYPNNNKSPQLSFTPYGVFNTNMTDNAGHSDLKWKYYNLAWEKPGQDGDWANIQSLAAGMNSIANRVGGVLKFTKQDYITASAIITPNDTKK